MRRSVVVAATLAIGVAGVIAGILLGFHHVQGQYVLQSTPARAVYGSESCGSPFQPRLTSIADTPAGRYGANLPYSVYVRSTALLSGCRDARTAPLAGALVLIVGGVMLALAGAVLGSLAGTRGRPRGEA